jgi:hypothetical protein
VCLSRTLSIRVQPLVHRALALLRSNELGADYAAAWDEWAASGAEPWDATVADGLTA